MKIILITHSTAEYNGDCHYAVLEVTPDLLELVRRRMELARRTYEQDNDFLELYFWDSQPAFYDRSLLDACQAVLEADESDSAEEAARTWLDELETSESIAIPAGVDLAALAPKRTECHEMMLRLDGSKERPLLVVAWSAIPKHIDATVTTGDLSLPVLESFCGPDPSIQNQGAPP
jgi:hypothetical protein